MEKAVPRSLVIAEEVALVRDALAVLCERDGQFCVLATTACGEEAWRLVEELHPDLILLDLRIPRLHSLEIAKRLAEPLAGERPYVTRAVILGERADRKSVIEVLRAGAQGYVLKSSSGAQLLECLEQVACGGVYVSPGIDVRSLFAPARAGASDDPLSRLSAREHQVFSLLVEGVRAKEIAARLQLSAKTVDTYRAGLMKKLDIFDVAGLVRLAMERHILPS
jgi:DNA-binding NarL/FixJ family response regulator